MGGKPRESGIDVIGAVPWGTHLCQLYHTKRDLVDTLVPYFKAGLENNELCVWITSATLSEKEAERAMSQAMPDFAKYLQTRQIEIIPHTEWYLKDSIFNGQRVLNAWIDKLHQALDTGYDGMRITGDTAWVEKRDWRKFADYEEEVNNVIVKYNMLAIGTYPLHKFGAGEIIDVIGDHQFAFTRQAGNLVSIKSSVHKRAKESQVMPYKITSGRDPPPQARFIREGFKGLSDQEVVELLLSVVFAPQKQKHLAKKCIEHFKSLQGLMSASIPELQKAGLTPSCIFGIRMLHELPEKLLKQKIIKQPVYRSPKEIVDYLYYSMRDLDKEVFKVIYLNKRNQIIDTADLFEGTRDGISIQPREIVESAFLHNAPVLIFVHNHPSGDPAPSKSDKQLTRDLVFIGNILLIKVLDHIIIGAGEYYSFADDGLIQKYDDAFLNLKIRGVFASGASCLHSVNKTLQENIHHRHSVTALPDICYGFQSEKIPLHIQPAAKATKLAITG